MTSIPVSLPHNKHWRDGSSDYDMQIWFNLRCEQIYQWRFTVPERITYFLFHQAQWPWPRSCTFKKLTSYHLSIVKGLLWPGKVVQDHINPSFRVTSNLHHQCLCCWLSYPEPCLPPGNLVSLVEDHRVERRRQRALSTSTFLHVSLVPNHQRNTSPHLLSSCCATWPPLRQSLHHLRSVSTCWLSPLHRHLWPTKTKPHPDLSLLPPGLKKHLRYPLLLPTRCHMKNLLRYSASAV